MEDSGTGGSQESILAPPGLCLEPRRIRAGEVFANVRSLDRIIHAIFNRFNQGWKNHNLELPT